MSGKRILTMLCGILMIIGGVFCLFRPMSTFLQMGYIIGVVMLCDAIGNIAMWITAKKYVEVSGWYLVGAILSLIFAIALICSIKMQLVTDILVTYIVAAWVVILGAIRILVSFRLRAINDKLPESVRSNRWMAVLLLGILIVVLGLIFFMRPVALMAILGVLIAWAMILIGANLLTIGTYIF